MAEILDLNEYRLPHGELVEALGWKIYGGRQRIGKTVDLVNVGDDTGAAGDVIDISKLGLSRVREVWYSAPVGILPGGAAPYLLLPLPSSGIVRLVGS